MALRNIAFALSISSAIVVNSPVMADTWNVDPGQSTLGFEVQQGEGTLRGTFATWTASIEFDPNAPETAEIAVDVKAMSASTGNPQFDGTMPGSEWFDVNSFPIAEFKADAVSLVEGNSYSADGTLTIKGISHPVKLDFTLDIDGDTAKAEGKATVNRLDYKLGSGVGTDTVGDLVTVTLDLTAIR
ncbi:MAG: YceI family protein [Roseibium sp.]|uniref:YceI family protein n=1 Tax=Roseibium sp. TaxID=1936156 RepID=UPI0026205184|nr:YceI family protein [Roseibium sp.]MCV0427499.1 YceI family protein [Roseibium sp.]